MAVKWTTEQSQVIESRGQTLLVSAAAGSGKTAVLVERVIRKILREDDPVDIDKLLIVTFTKAAAGEMKERILAAIYKALEDDPGNGHLQRQTAYINNARIMTIHSFCLQLLREHFQELSIDPSFRVAEEGEIRLLKADVMEALLEEQYESASPEFISFVEQYVAGKRDDRLDSLLLTFYEYAQSDPWPEDWMERCREAYHCEGEPEWVQDLIHTTKMMAEELAKKTEQAISICRETDGPDAYEAALQSDLAALDALRKAAESGSFDAIVSWFSTLSFEALSRKRISDADVRKKERVKAMRESVKKTLASYRSDFYAQTLGESLRQMREFCGADVFIDLAKEFSTRLQAEKRARNIVDFNDLEHMALQILTVKQPDGEVVPTQAAKELGEEFVEIMVDEYQDSNLVQDYILESISGGWKGEHHLFRVGDVKQSIYRFRMAKPELFLEKLYRYSADSEADERKIVLGRNFRSRTCVVDSVNTIFSQIMGAELGGIVYDAEAALYAGASYPDLPDGQDNRTELLLLTEGQTGGDGQSAEEAADDEEVPGNVIEKEAQMIASRIKELIASGFQVTDKATGELRKVGYGDIMILLRSISRWGETMTDVLLSEGIPAYCETSSGYFTTTEVRTILALLSVIDNPRNDIPLTAVLHSPIGGLDNTELAVIRSTAALKAKEEGRETGSFYDCVQFYRTSGTETATRQKLERFFERLETYQTASAYMGMEELLTYVLADSGFLDYVTAMPSGDRRRSNLEMLRVKAAEFEKGSYRGLFRFLHYMQRLQKYDLDYGEALPDGGADSVRIMSIHKSKGLEFGVTIVAGLGKQFNQTDSREAIVLHSDLGIGMNAIDTNKRSMAPTLLKKIIAKRIKEESLGEELRVLYVAMTRAKEKLILSGSIGDLAGETSKADRWFDVSDREECLIDAGWLAGSQSMLDWIGGALIRTKAAKPLYELRKDALGINGVPCLHTMWESGNAFLVSLRYTEGFRKKDEPEKREIRKNEIIGHAVANGARMKAEFARQFSASEASCVESQMAAKMSVSELKRRYMEDEEAKPMYQEQAEEAKDETLTQSGAEPLSLSGGVNRETSSIRGARRGTVYHRILELWDYTSGDSKEAIQDQIESMVMRSALTQEESDSVSVWALQKYLRSPLGVRMKQAFLAGTLQREKQFVMRVPASLVYPDYKGDEFILIQGMVDAYFKENGHYVIVDYKTDRVDNEEALKERYAVQLFYYKKALSQALGETVGETWIFSFSLNKEILIGEEAYDFSKVD